MRKSFSLPELIVAIVTISIILSIVIIEYSNMKKESIKSTISTNIKILQLSIDEYYLKNSTYPLKGDFSLTLSEPQLIDIAKLREDGFLKKELDLSKIKKQYYWVDVFGTVWGSTQNDIHSINLFESNDKNNMEFIIGEKIKGYNVYEVKGYQIASNGKTNYFANNNLNEPIKKVYKMVQETTVKGDKSKVINFETPKKDSDYLISIVDEYGLESAPFGKFSNSKNGFKPILKREGVFEFETTSSETMYWVNFFYIANTPGDSSVTFSFKVKDEDGVYSEWQQDFFSLKESSGIVVRVELKGDSKGNKPSLEYMKIISKYKVEKSSPKAIPSPKESSSVICPKSPISSDLSRTPMKKQVGNMVYEFINKDTNYLNSRIIPELIFYNGVSYGLKDTRYMVSLDNSTYVNYEKGMNVLNKCMIVIYNVEIKEIPPNEVVNKICEEEMGCHAEYCNIYNNCPIPPETNIDICERKDCQEENACLESLNCQDENTCKGSSCSQEVVKSCIELNNCKKPIDIGALCGEGGTRQPSFSSNKGKFVFDLILEYNQSLSRLDVPTIANSYKITRISLEYSKNQEDYKVATSILEIPAGSCVKIIYDVILNCEVSNSCSNYAPIPPTIGVCEVNQCPKPCDKDCSTPPELCLFDCENPKDSNDCKTKDCTDNKNPNDGDTSEDEKDTSTCENCSAKECEVNCLYPPNNESKTDPVLNEEGWTTIDKIKFFSQSSQGEKVLWYRAEHEEVINDKENTRIIYRYAKSNGGYWSKEYDDFTTTGLAGSVMATAYIQVRTNQLSNISEEQYPTVKRLTFYNEKGYTDVSVVQPTVTIIAKKDNNISRETFSDKSNIEWSYVAADPRNKDIIDVEWNGDIRSNYPAGQYVVQVRVKNELQVWSSWVSLKFKVELEKPVAVLTFTKKPIGDKYEYTWSTDKSFDQDGDGIVNYETRNINKFYPVGQQVAELRVQDKEGYWSDWTSVSFLVVENLLLKSFSFSDSSSNRAFAIFGNGTVKGWGRQDNGELGVGNRNSITTPTWIGSLFNVKQISAGYNHTLFLLENGEVYAAGMNTYGQLGTGINQHVITPVKIAGISNVKEVYAGSYISIALLESGEVMSWGSNSVGMLGLGNTNTPKVENNIPTKIPTLTNVKTITGGSTHILALLNDGTIKVWGDNSSGKLGLGHNNRVYTPTTVGSLSGVKSIHANYYSSGVVLEDSTIRLWGGNSNGQIGMGSQKEVLIPTEPEGIKNVEKLSLGYSHAFVVLKDGSVLGTGYSDIKNMLMIEKNERFIYKFTKSPYLSELPIKEIYSSNLTSAILLETGELMTWAKGGDLALGRTVSSSTPINIPHEVILKDN